MELHENKFPSNYQSEIISEMDSWTIKIGM